MPWGARSRAGGNAKLRKARGALAVLFLFAAGFFFLGSLGLFGPEGRTTLSAVLLYLAGSAGAMLLAFRAVFSRTPRRPLLAALLAGAAVRLSLAWIAPLDFDMQSYAIVVNAMNRGQVVYEATDRYNYSPAWAHILQATATISRTVGVSPFFGFRFVTILGDALVAWALFLLTRVHGTPRRAAARAVLWWVNPVPIAVSAYGGQFDALAIGVLLLGLALANRARGRGESLLPALLVGAAIALKQITVLWLAGFLGFARTALTRLRDALLAVLPFGVLVVPYLFVVPRPVIRNVFRYASHHGLWGWYYLLRLSGGDVPFPTVYVSYAGILAGSFLAYRLVRSGDDGLRAGRVAAVIFLAATPGFSLQMLTWPLAFAPERREAFPAALYTVFGAAVWAEFLRLHWPNPLTGLLTWAALLFWLTRLLPALPSRPFASRVMVQHGK